MLFEFLGLEFLGYICKQFALLFCHFRKVTEINRTMILWAKQQQTYLLR